MSLEDRKSSAELIEKSARIELQENMVVWGC